MSGRSAIEWTETTWNPTTGCDKVSPGCERCPANCVPPPRAWPCNWPPGAAPNPNPTIVN
jgi:hypothetical protein